jgi:inhibitor of cysteine peptidase
MTFPARMTIGIILGLICLIEVSCRKANESHDMLHIDRASNNTEQTVTVGQQIEVSLTENPTTGFRWELESNGNPVLDLVNDAFDSAPGGVGKAGVRTWRFNAVREGTGSIVLMYRRSFERSNPPAEVFRFTVHVNP